MKLPSKEGLSRKFAPTALNEGFHLGCDRAAGGWDLGDQAGLSLAGSPVRLAPIAPISDSKRLLGGVAQESKRRGLLHNTNR